MSLLTTIDRMPLFSTIEEAIAWGAQRGLVGYHTHEFGGVTGYMAGTTHGQSGSSAQGAPANNTNNNTNNMPAGNGGNTY